MTTRLAEMDILYRLLTMAGTDKLTEHAFYDICRARRHNGSYLHGLRARMEAEKRYYLLTLVCRNVISRMSAPRFRRRLNELEKQAEEGEFRLPPKSA